MATKKSRNWSGVFYPESAPEDWIERIQSLHLRAFVSPLHQADDEVLKPHYHVLWMFDGPTTEAHVRGLMESVVSSKVVQYCYSLKGLARYLLHLDDPDKEQFPDGEVMEFAGARYQETIRGGDDTCSDILEFCEEFNVCEYSEIVDYARRNRPEWSSALRLYVHHFTAYFRSARHGYEEKMRYQYARRAK